MNHRRRSDRHEAPTESRRQPTHLHWTPEHQEVRLERNPRWHPVRRWLAALWATLTARV